MNANRDFKGVWIPKEIWLSTELTLIEKLFLVEIDSLDGKEGCFATNAHFAEFFQISKGRCSQIIKSLEAKKLVKIDIQRKNKVIVKRTIRVVSKLNKVVNKLNNPIKNTKQPYLENDEGSNTKDNNTKERESAPLKSFVCSDFEPSQETLDWLKIRRIKPLSKDELTDFVLYYQEKGNLAADWQAVYKRWTNKQRNIFDKQRANHLHPSTANNDTSWIDDPLQNPFIDPIEAIR